MKITEIKDKSTWEKFILENSPQSLFQSWNWGEAVVNSSSSNLRSWRLALMDTPKKLNGIAFVTKITAKRGTFLHIRHGPIFKNNNISYLSAFTDSLILLAKKEKAAFIRVSPLIPSSDKVNLIFQKLGYRFSPLPRLDGEYCWVLDISPSEDKLLAAMRKTTRYLIRRSKKLNVRIEKSSNPADISSFLPLYAETAKRHGFVRHKGITEEFSAFAKDNQALLFKGFYNNKLLSAALIIFYNHQAIYHHSASIEQKIPVNYLLQWEVIKEAKKRDKLVYNFWGIAPENGKRHPWRNLTLFKKGFGGRVVEYTHARDLPVNLPLYAKTYLIEYTRKIARGY